MTLDRPRSRHDQLSLSRRALGRLAAGTGIGLAAPAIIARAQPAALRLSSIQAITGPSAAYGWRARDGAQLTADQINATGLKVGGTTYRLEIVVQDMANDPQQAITLLRQAASDSTIAGVIGPSNSVGFVPILPAAGQLQMPMVGAGSGAAIKQWNKWSFRANPVSATAIPVLLRKVHEKVAFKRLAVVYDQTQDGQAADARVCKAMAGQLSYEVVAFEAFRAGDQDFSAQLATVRSVRPDAVFLAAATGDGVKVASQVRELGIMAPMMTGFGSFQDTVYWDGTQGDIKGGFTWLAQDLASPSPGVKSFMDGYRKNFHQEATSFATYGADAVSALAGAIQKAGSTARAEVQKALASLDVTTPIGTHLTFQNPPDGENKTPTVVVIEITGRGTYTTL
jgi:branched-chain amino acid transport system substrate-binding protein